MDVVDELWALPRWTQSRGEELANTISHGIGLLAGLIGTPVLLVAALHAGNGGFLVGTIIFAVTMLMLYLGSTLYHAWPQTRVKCVLQVFDHSAIFLLIAGTYTPFVLGPLRGLWGWTMFGVIWSLAIFGVIMKATRGTSHHPKLALCLYLGMGWLGLVAIRPLSAVVPALALLGLFAGGIAYTMGVIFFVNERRRYNHFVWHLFVLTGTSCHFLALLACTG
ncbi:MAG: hemolysin D [Verrucomicrobia bacterium]|nr:MAG: hemolysin D [Verrucomicrobiota bacterium]